jgi:hypothetical protein
MAPARVKFAPLADRTVADSSPESAADGSTNSENTFSLRPEGADDRHYQSACNEVMALIGLSSMPFDLATASMHLVVPRRISSYEFPPLSLAGELLLQRVCGALAEQFGSIFRSALVELSQ